MEWKQGGVLWRLSMYCAWCRRRWRLVGMVMLGSHADPTGVGLAGLQLRLGHLPRRCLLWWLRSADGALPMAEFAPNSAKSDW